ncbi:hypothetical protein [Amycolatopsis taiwanensis]|uniref:Uncharacterized protein n=1 Tax=Amycolatopsis taiwanensis TaxID=342230 RepID=A0A9W6VEU3_9PSEU|nr:hypothetical protein [Amycolatopsis taiwanensis]GLY64822.1 hypothetical protein Atai01_14410 [Amycolatopsis taiwanensis]
MGIDLELADVAAARYQLDSCEGSGRPCAHAPGCEKNLCRLLGRGPSKFPYRRFRDINENMRLTGMGYQAEPETETILANAPDNEQAQPDRASAHLRWRSQTVPGKTGIPAFKLESNDRWLVTTREIDEALAAYAQVSAEQRAVLETDPKWVSWLEWLALARERGGFEAE